MDKKKRKYKLRTFIVDCVMIPLTGGLWFVWIFCREMRNR